MTYDPTAIAREAAEAYVDAVIRWGNRSYEGIMPIVEPFILAAAARIVKESGAREALEEASECATAIRRNIDEDMGGIPVGDIWLTTIRAHAYVIKTDGDAALANLAKLEGRG